MSQLSTSYPSGELIRNIMQETVLCGLIWTNWSVSRIFHCTWETQWNTAFSKYLQTSFTSWKFILWCKHVMQPSDTVEDPEVLIMALAIERPGSFLFSFFSYSFPTLSISFDLFRMSTMGDDGPWVSKIAVLWLCDSVTPQSIDFRSPPALERMSHCLRLGSFAGPDTKIQKIHQVLQAVLLGFLLDFNRFCQICQVLFQILVANGRRQATEIRPRILWPHVAA